MKNIVFVLILISFTVQSQYKIEPLDEAFKRFLNVRDFTLSNSGKEAYFTIQTVDEANSIIVSAKLEDGKWGDFKITEFSKQYRNIEPFLSPDNLRLYFSSNRPKSPKSTEVKDYDIWFVERANLNSSWSKPINIGAPINTEFNEFYPSISKNKTMYYTSDKFAKTRRDEIMFSTFKDGTYQTPIVLNDNVNSEKYEFNAFISPNEDFLIYTVYNAKDGLGSGDLYISFKDNNGEFTKRKNLTVINSNKMDYCPFYDAKTNTLYFTSKRNNAEYKGVKSLNEFETLTKNYNNGFSRLYKVKLDLKNFKK